MIVECEFILTGIVLTYSKEFDVFRVDHIYKPDKTSEITEFVVQKGQDSVLLISFALIVKAFLEVYGPQVQVAWHRDATHVEQWYLQLRKVGTPCWVGLDGQWIRWMER